MISDSVITAIRHEAERHEENAGEHRTLARAHQADADACVSAARNSAQTALEHRRALAELTGEPVVEHTPDLADSYIDQARTIASLHVWAIALPAPTYVISGAWEKEVHGSFHGTSEVRALDQLAMWAEAMRVEITTCENAASVHHTITFDWSEMTVKLTVIEQRAGGGSQ